MTDQPHDVDALKAIMSADQRSASEKEHDAALMKCSAFTAAHWRFLTNQGLPAHLVDRLTVEFQEQYLSALLAPSYSFLSAEVEDE